VSSAAGVRSTPDSGTAPETLRAHRSAIVERWYETQFDQGRIARWKIAGTESLSRSEVTASFVGPLFDLLSLITVPLFNDHFNRRTANAAEAAGLEVVKIEKSLLGIINLIACRV